METTELDLDAPGGELLGAIAYLAVLAYPESHRKRDRCVSALLALCNRAARDAGKPTAAFASELFDEVPHHVQARTLSTTGRKGMLPRVRRRLVAADAAAHAFLGQSINKAAKRSGMDESYFMYNIWAKSKPVLHLALALREVLLSWQHDGHPIYLQLIARPSWVRSAIVSAENWRVMLSAEGRAPAFMREINPDDFIRLLPAHTD